MRFWRGARASWQRSRDRWLLAAASLLLVATFVDPGVTMERARFDLVIVLDVTQSMNVTDVNLDGKPVPRLTYAKHALHQVLPHLPCGSKIGWAIFTEYRSLLLLEPIEVCANLSELRSTLAQIDGRMAWSGGSEIAKGVHSAIGMARLLPGKPSLVFITDGQEAPPLNPRYRPAFDDVPGEVSGLIVGVGDLLPSPIPKTDPLGRPLGYWRADEVMQTDPRSQGRGASVKGEMMADDRAGAAAPALGATPGTEHLSSLREGYLRMLAGEQHLAFLRLQAPQDLAAALMSPALARPVPVRTDARGVLAGLAFCLLMTLHSGPLLRLMGARRSAEAIGRTPKESSGRRLASRADARRALDDRH